MTSEESCKRESILTILKDFFRGYLGKCFSCDKELFLRDEIYHNKHTNDLSCEDCYMQYIKPDLDKLKEKEMQS